MKAVVLTAYGDVNGLEIRDVPEPPVGAGEIRVRMAGASINPIDWKLRSGALQTVMPLALPTILGRDASGEVVEVGSGVTRFKVGARVLGLVTAAYAEFVVAAAKCWAEVPAQMDLVDAAALPLALLTGSQLIDEAVRPSPGDTVLVTGAVGSVGRVAVFAAKARRATVWAGVRRSQKAQAATLGVAGVVALDDEGELDDLPPLDAIADTIGGSTTQKLLTKLKPGGTLGSIVGEAPGAKERGFMVRAIFTHPDADRLAMLAQRVAEGSLVVPISRMLPLAQAGEAQLLAEQHPAGKVILTGALRFGASRRAIRDREDGDAARFAR